MVAYVCCEERLRVLRVWWLMCVARDGLDVSRGTQSAPRVAALVHLEGRLKVCHVWRIMCIARDDLDASRVTA